MGRGKIDPAKLTPGAHAQPGGTLVYPAADDAAKPIAERLWHVDRIVRASFKRLDLLTRNLANVAPLTPVRTSSERILTCAPCRARLAPIAAAAGDCRLAIGRHEFAGTTLGGPGSRIGPPRRLDGLAPAVPSARAIVARQQPEIAAELHQHFSASKPRRRRRAITDRVDRALLADNNRHCVGHYPAPPPLREGAELVPGCRAVLKSCARPLPRLKWPCGGR